MQNSEPSLERLLTKELQGEVRFDPYSKALYSTDASLYQIEPIGVVVPKHKQDVIRTIQIAAERQIPILPRGGGTSLAGQCVGKAIVLDMSKYMNKLIAFDVDEHWARVEPGIILDELNHQLKPHGLMYAPDVATSSRANVGGTIGNNSAGSHSLIYGKTIDHVMSLDLVLANADEITASPLSFPEVATKKQGNSVEAHIYREVCRICDENADEIRKQYPRILRRVAGYNLDEYVSDAGSKEVTPYRRDGCDNHRPFSLAKIVVGSEGTLATTVEATVNLVSIPKMTSLCVVHFRSLIAAMEAMQPILACHPTAVELIDKTILGMAQGSIEFSRLTSFIQGEPEALLAVEFYGQTEIELHEQMDHLEKTLKSDGFGYAFVRCYTPEEKARVWETRKAGLGLLMGMKGDAKPIGFVEDAAVPIENLPEYVRRFDEIVTRHDTTASYYAHASVGLLHNRPVINLKSESDIHKMHSIAREVRDLLMELDGAMSGEHGDGLVRSEWIESMFGPQIYQALREVKNAFDPDGIMNPGKIIDPPPMTENLRFGPKYNTIEIDTYFDFSAQDGFDRSIEMCNGVGACRKTLTGTMCPSFIATLEEEHSTRGRANALRSIISGALPHKDFTSERLYDVLDLCLGCKACKAECPSNVDMAKIKYEVLAHYRKANGLPLRNRLFGEIGSLAVFGSMFAPFSNLATNNPFSKWMAEKILGVDRRRDMPTFVHRTFEKWFRKRKSQNTFDKKVVLFHDTFLNYSEPNIGKAAVNVLEAAGFQVILPEKRCCGRPLISEGMLDKAIDNANYNIEQLHTYVEQGIPIVCCEPSCTSALNDDYVDLINTKEAKQVADSTYAIEEFLLQLHHDGELPLTFKDMHRKILLHGHCHQRALDGIQPVLQMLELPKAHNVSVIDSSCCGMAGSFGYDKTHYDISMNIGELRLFPIIREESGNFLLAASGFSCRHQLQHGTGFLPKHPIEVLSAAIVSDPDV
ncbi:anaerobic glycerol-3-phosphate dehydrogenase subunit C [Candidatus Poribacteria bacterium]|nr:anaerobic glycerol-3-phosphate dehydrogenase subunit C [Candidatus Poribacteria bacterium]MYB66480.1 anaerobic glycerol-3-phosphate dehydrogenase subunit C [Candidatus Poribacteria bacterium]MYF55590.1 anaerobic glycerol-3-phosphate dehydrogenase subunit C [Candidatus Poribacteria bacterium]MYI94128.1 anaerobic glycerol-3-phosphate dehydrogenase subunit C [Candidatus Poribacteria bacterium]